MPLVETKDKDIKPENLTLDYYLEAIPVRNTKAGINMTGLETYKIGPYSESLGFGITSIEIDIKPNLQPIIVVSFKDLYGNLVFNRESGFGYDVLFQSPYPRFKFYFKGYVGRGVSYMMQVKSVKTSYVPTDGSYDIKAEFVPNVLGFFADIPYQFLFAIPDLKGDNSPSILDIAKNGYTISEKIKQSEDRYRATQLRLEQLVSGPLKISDYYDAGELSLSPIEGDSALNKKGFKKIVFNIDTIDPATKKNYANIPDPKKAEVFGNMILASINNNSKKYSFSNPTDKIDAKILDNAAKILQENLTIIQNVSRQVGSTNSELLIDSQSIYNVMLNLVGGCAYILGYILEGGINGFNGDQQRLQNKELIGLYYPLIENNVLNETSLSAQVPYEGAKTEIEHVEKFVKALYQGRKRVQKIIDRAQAQSNNDSQPQFFSASDLVYKMSNAESAQANPYAPYAENIIVNLIQRAGIISAGYGGTGTFIAQNINEFTVNEFTAAAEFANIESVIYNIRDDNNTGKLDKTNLRNFCEEIINFSFFNGDLKKQFTDETLKTKGLTYNDYFISLMNSLPDASSDLQQFSSSSPNTLKSVYTKNNNIVYYSPKSLVDAIKTFDPSANDLLTNSTSQPEILCIVPRESVINTLATEMENLTADDRTKDTKIIKDLQNQYLNFFQWWSSGFSSFTYSTQSKRVFVDFNNLAVSTPNVREIFKIYDEATLKNDDYKIFKIIDANIYKLEPKEYIIDFYDKRYRSVLTNLCNRVLAIVKKSDSELEKLAKKKYENDQTAANSKVTTSSSSNKPYKRDQNEIDSVYVQFNHICQAWISLVNNTDDNILPDGTNVKLADEFEKRYRSVDDNDSFYLNFEFPLMTDGDEGVDVRKAIVNTEPLLGNNNQTSTFNMMQNICQLNNFLLQPIPGGITKNLDELFTPIAVEERSGALGNNALSVIWSPTPENRYTNNKNEPIYPEKNFLQEAVSKVSKTIPALRYGDPENVIVKSIKAGTSDNKITSESIKAAGDIVNNTNQNKKKGFDCSMLAVMQGRSYNIDIDLIGNSQIYPSMFVGVDGLPIFTGLYWITDVQHKITPNNMETQIGAVKLKYDGNQFVAIPPVTKREVIQYTVNGKSDSSYSFSSGVLNYEFLQKIKDVKIKNTSDIDNIIKVYTSGKYNTFVGWFNNEVAGKKQESKSKINEQYFKICWDSLIPICWEKYGSNGINFLEFLALHCVIYNECGGTYKSTREGMNPNTLKVKRPGIAYAFDYIPKEERGKDQKKNKASYNVSSLNSDGSIRCMNAYELFNDPDFISAHGSKKFGNDSRVLKTNNDLWKGKEFPQDLFKTDGKLLEATDPFNATFINEADFFKFSGRGFIGTTWRYAYKKVLEWILTYAGTDPVIVKYRDRWKSNPYNSQLNKILTMSSNADWDDLFINSGALAGRAVNLHSGTIGYQYISDLTLPVDQLTQKVHGPPKYVSGGIKSYIETHFIRVCVILDTLYPQGVNSRPVNNNNNNNNNNNTTTNSNNRGNQGSGIVSTDGDWFVVDGVDLQTIASNVGITLTKNYGAGASFDDTTYQSLKTKSNIQYAVYDVSANKFIATSSNANKNVYGASVVKAIASAVAYEKNNGKITSTSDVGKILKLMIKSDNNVWSDVERLAGGSDAINQFAVRNNYNGIKPARKSPNNRINSVGMCLFWNDVIRKNFKGAEDIFKMSSSNQKGYSRSVRYIPTDVVVGSKTGSYSDPDLGNVMHDSGWVYSKGKFYTITVLSEGGRPGSEIGIMWGGLFKEYCK